MRGEPVMAISRYAGKTLPELWMVTQDGAPILRGRPKSEAERFAEDLGRNLPGKRAGTKIHSPHIELKYDDAAMQQRADLYTEFRGYRRGD